METNEKLAALAAECSARVDDVERNNDLTDGAKFRLEDELYQRYRAEAAKESDDNHRAASATLAWNRVFGRPEVVDAGRFYAARDRAEAISTPDEARREFEVATEANDVVLERQVLRRVFTLAEDPTRREWRALLDEYLGQQPRDLVADVERVAETRRKPSPMERLARSMARPQMPRRLQGPRPVPEPAP